MRHNAYTLTELLVVIGIFVILSAMAIPAFNIFGGKSSVSNNAQEIISVLRLAQSRAFSSEGASQWGVYFNNGVTPNTYTLFRGSSFASRDAGFDEVSKLSQGMELYEVNLAGGPEAVFDRLLGSTIHPGTVKLRSVRDLAETKTVTLNSGGMVMLGEDIAPAMLPQKDSRHVHFDLGWSIQNAATLKFYFPIAVQTELINMAGYFNADKTNFDWSGSFSVGGISQEFRVHAHSLSAFNTLLSVHRDRNGGKNNQEVIIYIVDGGTEKDIAHYLADALDTVERGTYAVNSMEIQ